MSIDYNKCAYINPEKQNANVMMRPCINGSDPLVWPCIERETLDKDIFSLVTERPQGDNVPEILTHSLSINCINYPFYSYCDALTNSSLNIHLSQL